MKSFFLIFICGLSTASITFAQKANIPAPQKSQFVLEYNLPFIFSKTNAQRLNQNSTARQIYGELIERNNNFESEMDITHSGIDHNFKAYMHTVTTDSLGYTVKLVALSNESEFKKTVGIDKNTISKVVPQGIIYTLEYKEKVFIPKNKEYAILVSTSQTYNAFNDSARAARWGMENEYSYNNNDYTEATVAEAYTEDEDPRAMAVDTVAVATAVAEEYPVREGVKEATVYEVKRTPAEIRAIEAANAAADEANGAAARSKKVPNAPKAEVHYTVPPPPIIESKENIDIVEVESPNFDDDTTGDNAPVIETYNYNDYEDGYEIKRQKKDSIFSIWTENYIVSLVDQNKDTYAQLQDLKGFKTAKNTTAASFFILNMDVSDLGTIGRLYFLSPSSMINQPTMQNSNWTRFDLNFEEQDISVSGEALISPQLAKSSKRIYRRKLNCKIKKYIDSKNDIGVAVMKANTKNYLEELPKMVKESFEKMDYFTEEAGVMADLFAISVDEKAVGKLIWGDAAFVFTDLKEKTYKTTKYEYNEETFVSSSKEIDKTEKLPNFLFMFTTKNTKMMTKILNLGVKKGVFEMNDGIYASQPRYSMEPFSYYCTIKNGIVFMATDLNEIQQIKAGKRRGKLSAHDKKLIRRNSSSGWFIPSKMDGIYSSRDEEGSLNSIRFNNLLNSVERMEFQTGKMKNNKMTGSMNLHTPKANGNTLDYLLLLIEDMKSL